MITSGSLIQNRYRVVRPLGSGGFGTVFLAEDLRLGRQVAIKELGDSHQDAHASRLALELFEREALMLARLDHNGLTRVWDYFQEEHHAFLVMEFVPGWTLRDLLRRIDGALPEQLVCACGLQLCAVLSYLHSRTPPIIFRDLKPANVMLLAPAGMSPSELLVQPPDELVFKLIDFGIARFFKQEQSGDTLVIGTPGYAPPEQYGQGQTTVRSDIYSLGATMFHLLSGQAPSGFPLPSLAEVAPWVRADLAAVVARATALSPQDRYPNVEALRRDLLAVAQSQPGYLPPARPAVAERRGTPRRAEVPRAPTSAPLRPRSSSSGPLLLIAGILVVVLLGVFLLGMWNLNMLGNSGGAASVPSAAPDTATGEWRLDGAPGRISFGRENASGGYDLLVATLDGAAPQALIQGGDDIAAAWSPDGRQVAITHGVGGMQSIVVGPTANPVGMQVSPAGTNARYPAWSPDGRRLAFALRDGGIWQLDIVELSNGQISRVDTGGVGWISWGSGALLYAAVAGPNQSQDIFALDVSGTPRNLTNTPDIEEDFPARSPDGQHIAFVSSPAGAGNLGQRQIMLMNADGSGRTQLTQQPGPHTNPVWSPDGAWIAYLSKQAGGDWQVWAMRADGSAHRQLTLDPAQKFYLAWGQ